MEVMTPPCKRHSAHINISTSYSAIYFLLNELPSVNLALPPVGVHKTVEQLSQVTAVCACEKTVVMFKHPWHLTSMK